MKEGLFILALLIVSSYAIDIRHPGAQEASKTLKPAPVPKQSAGSHPAVAFRAKKTQARRDAAAAARLQQVEAAKTAAAAVAHVETDQQLLSSQTGVDNSSSSTGHIKQTPGAPCNTYTTCVECTDDDSLAFYCMWSAARNVCQEDTDMDKLKRSNPEDLWTKQCAPKTPDPITDCGGCPILAIDHKPARDIVDSKIKGSNGDEVSATEGDLHLLGTDPNDPVTGPILFPNGTNNPQFLLPSIRDDDGNIKDPVQDPEKLIYSPCVGDGTCSASRFMSKTRKGKFAPDLLTDDDSSSKTETDEPRMKESRHKPHVDKVEMQDAQLDDGENKDNDDATTNAASPADSSELEISSRVVKGDEDAAATPAAGGGFTPAFSDDDTSSSKTDTTPAASSSSVDEPRFTQSKRSEFKGMSAEKQATQPKENTMEVTEFDDNVVGGKRINEDEDAQPTKEEAQ